jgi:TRAP-type C4-dicarboxylate transport system permease small subunit
MGWFDRFKNRVQILNRWISIAGAVFLIPLMLGTAADVICRDLFNLPIMGVVESSGYLLAVFILLGLGYAEQVKAHVKVTIMTSRLSPRAQLVLRIITSLISLFIFSILAWQGLIVGIEERTVSDLLRIPQYPFRILVAVGAFFVCLELLIDFGDSVRKLARWSS